MHVRQLIGLDNCTSGDGKVQLDWAGQLRRAAEAKWRAYVDKTRVGAEYLPHYLTHVREVIFVPITASGATDFILDVAAKISPNRVVHFVDDNLMG